MASGRGGTTPARGGRLPSCREDIQAESGIHALRFSEQRLALDAVLCGGLIRVKGARLRIRHRLAPLPLAAPRDAAFAAPPASPSPKCGISGIPAAVGRIVRLKEASGSRPPEGILPSLGAASLPPRQPRPGAACCLPHKTGYPDRGAGSLRLVWPPAAPSETSTF